MKKFQGKIGPIYNLLNYIAISEFTVPDVHSDLRDFLSYIVKTSLTHLILLATKISLIGQMII